MDALWFLCMYNNIYGLLEFASTNLAEYMRNNIQTAP